MREHIKQYLKQYVEKFEALNIAGVEALILFGSQARDSATISSDIDIAVVVSEPLDVRSRGLLRCLGDDINPHIETNLFFTTPEALESPQHHFDTNTHIKREGVALWGGLAT